MIYSESIMIRLNSYHRNLVLRSKIASAAFMIMGLGLGISAIIVLLHKVNLF